MSNRQELRRALLAGGTVVCLAAVAAAVALILLGGSGEGGNSPDEIVAKASAAVRRDGMAFHAKGDDGSEVWIDADGQRYRAVRRSGTRLLTAVGEGWTETTYDPEANAVSSKDSTLANVPRIDDPMILWFEPLSALAYGAEITDLGETTADGKNVIAVESRTPIAASGQPTGRFLLGRLELDPETYLVQAFERRLQLPPGETPDPQSVGNQLGTQNVRIRYEVSEFVPLADLPADFFDKSHVDEQVVTLEKSIAEIRDAGVTPYWLSGLYEGSDIVLVLQPLPGGVAFDAKTGMGSLNYALGTPDGAVISADAVIIRLAKPGRAEFPQPAFPQYAGHLPESPSEITVGGRPAAMGVSILTPAALPCPTGTCPETDAPLFIRLQLQLDGAAVQIETYARVDESGTDQNGYNTESGIIQLAEALTPAP